MMKETSVDIKNVVNLAREEEIINVYEGFKTQNPSGLGYFLITNFRFIFFKKTTEWRNKTVNMLEIPIGHIGGIKSEYGRKAVKLQVLIALSVMLLGLVGVGLNFVLGKFMLYIGVALFVIGLLIVIFSRRRVFTIEIFTKSTIGSVVSITNDYLKLNKATRIVVRPETFAMIRDLGKSIMEAQRYRPVPGPVTRNEEALPKIE
jgi:hypothetical protein